MELRSVGSEGKKKGRWRKRPSSGWAYIQLSRATEHGATPSCHVIRRIARVPAWHLGHAKACGVTLQGVTPRNLARPKGLVFENLDRYGLFIKY